MRIPPAWAATPRRSPICSTRWRPPTTTRSAATRDTGRPPKSKPAQSIRTLTPIAGGSNPARGAEGAGGTQDSGNAGQDRETRSATDPLTAAAADPAGTSGYGEVAGSLMGKRIASVLGGVSGAAGGLLGALSGAGQQLQQAGSQLVGGLAQGANAAIGNPKPVIPEAEATADAAVGWTGRWWGGPERQTWSWLAGRGAAGPLACTGGKRPRSPRPPPRRSAPATSATTATAGGMPGGGAMHAADHADGRAPRRRRRRGRPPAVSGTARTD